MEFIFIVRVDRYCKLMYLAGGGLVYFYPGRILDPTHDEGKHKARLFATVLGMTADNAEELQQSLLQIVQTNEARIGRRDIYGQRYTID